MVPGILGRAAPRWIQFTVGCLAVGVCYTAAQGYDWVTMWVILAVGIPFSGYLLGSTLLGVYLLISLNCWQVNQNEAFSALRIKDYKNFLRFCIKDDGSLELSCRVRRLGEAPILIEGPIRVQPSKIVEKNRQSPTLRCREWITMSSSERGRRHTTSVDP